MTLTCEPSPKRQRSLKVNPTSIVTWNCNGFISRCKWDHVSMKMLLEKTEYPDMICIQEARLKAVSKDSRGIPHPAEHLLVKETIESTFKDYLPIWSLADSRYAGTVTFLHRRLAIDLDTATCQCAFTSDTAIDVLLKRFELSRESVGLTAAKIKKKKEAKQTSMMAFFSRKKEGSVSASNIKATQVGNLSTATAHSEGRFQFFSFEDMDVIQTYVPNNGTKDDSVARRKDWDEMMLRFLKERKALLQSTKGANDRRLLWCGDFNCARDYRDGTHWEKRIGGKIYEFWTDTEKCKVDDKKAGVVIPGFTQSERSRFEQMLIGGDFRDIWRELHPDGDQDQALDLWNRSNYTWRGHLSRSDQFQAKFQGKGQRIDYFLLSPAAAIREVVSCRILGYGENREGFYGSDHCPIHLRLREPIDR